MRFSKAIVRIPGHSYPDGLTSAGEGRPDFLTTCAQHAITDFGDFQMRRDFNRNALQLAQFFQLCDEITQVVIFHWIWVLIPFSRTRELLNIRSAIFG